MSQRAIRIRRPLATLTSPVEGPEVRAATPPPRGLQWALARVGKGYGRKQKWAGRLVPVLPAGRTATTGVFHEGPIRWRPPHPPRPRLPRKGGVGGPPCDRNVAAPAPPPIPTHKRPLGMLGSLLAVLSWPAWGWGCPPHVGTGPLHFGTGPPHVGNGPLRFGTGPVLHILVPAFYTLVPARCSTSCYRLSTCGYRHLYILVPALYN